MPLQNRVDPYGTIFRSPARGTMMGNRGGVLHNEERMIVRRYKSRRWIACLLDFRGRWRRVMTPGRYTELFFLDEAVAFAAGHRPCAECRRDRFLAFQNAWKLRRANRLQAARAGDIDLVLHRYRIDEKGRKVTYKAPLRSLPNGCFIEIDGAASLVWDDALLLWTPDGYAKKAPRPRGMTVTVLTPRPIVECFRHGYQPETHASRAALAGYGIAMVRP
ncbi:MAG: hypothetical protein C5B51_28945 [Terriglobia bacterium]|nr:MAG: hypothetical protein C5B51_28945 [Terriglobia bacterium]